MNARDLRARVHIEAPIVQDGAVVWTHLASVWAKIAPARAGQRPSFDGVAPSAAYEAIVRARDGLEPGSRLVWGARRLRIVTVARRSDACGWLELHCVEES